MKACTRCGAPQESSEFYVHPRSGPSSICRTCDKAKSSAWKKANRARVNAAAKRVRDAGGEQVELAYRIQLNYAQLLRLAGLKTPTPPERVRKNAAYAMSRPQELRASWAKASSVRRRERLADSYIKALLCQNFEKRIPWDFIPDAMVEAKRLQILINKQLKEATQ